MKIAIEHFPGKYPQFNVSLATAEGKEPFVVIKGCRIINGSKGDFVSWPATKNESTGKYWNHVYASESFGQAVMDAAKKQAPAAAPRARDDAWRAGSQKSDDELPPF